MRKLLSFVVMIAFVITLGSCANRSIPEKLDSFVSQAEQNYENYSKDDWEKSRQEYQQLLDSYQHSDRQYTDEEKQMAARAIGRYHALLVKNGFNQAGSLLKQLTGLIPSYMEGFAEGLDENVDSLSKSLEQIFDEKKMEESMDKLEDSMEKFGSVIEKIFN